jgi:spore germination protein YaaH
MSHRGAGLILALALGFFNSAAQSAALKTWGYVGWWLPDSWRSVPIGEFDRLLVFELKIGPDGSITERNGWPEKWTEFSQAAKLAKTPVDLTLTLLDPAQFRTLFASDKAVEHLFEEVSGLAAAEQVAGIQLDVEIYTEIDRKSLVRYRSFVKRVAKKLGSLTPSRNLSVFFPIGGPTTLYDHDTLRVVNQVVLQGYDSHWVGSKTAGPLAPLAGNDSLNWRNAVSLADSLGIDRTKLLISFPLYGYEWQVEDPSSRSKTIGNGVVTTFVPIDQSILPDIQKSIQDRIQQFGAKSDPATGSMYYQFRQPTGEYYEGWFEDWGTLQRKAEYAERERIGGIAFFMLGYDGGQLVRQFLRRRGPRILN